MGLNNQLWRGSQIEEKGERREREEKKGTNEGSMLCIAV